MGGGVGEHPPTRPPPLFFIFKFILDVADDDVAKVVNYMGVKEVN